MDSFNRPQRQSLIGVLVMFTDSLQKLVRAFWPFLVIWVFKFNQINKLYLLIGVLSVIALVGFIAYLQYRNFTFYIDEGDEEFIVSSGVISKTKLAIQLEKIQQVNINQSLIQKLIGVHALEVETAGSTKKEVSIRAISHDLAVALKTRLLSEKGKVKTTEESIVEEQTSPNEPFIKISFLSLIKIGITSNYVKSFGLLFAFFWTIYENVKNFVADEEVVDGTISELFDANLAFVSLMLLILFLFVFIIIFNLGRTILRYFDYKIAKQNGSLLLSYGLLNTKNTILKPERVQLVALSQNWLQKKMNVMNLFIRQASGNESSKKTLSSIIEIPGCDQFEKDEILKLLFEQLPAKGDMLQPNWRKLLFPMLFFVVLPISIVLIYGLNFNPEIIEYFSAIPIYLIFVGLLLYFGFRNYRLFVNNNYIIHQSGAWDVDNLILEPHKIQSINVSQLFWHKSLNIGSLKLVTAGGVVHFHLGNFNRIKELVNVWLYQIEESDKNWM